MVYHAPAGQLFAICSRDRIIAMHGTGFFQKLNLFFLVSGVQLPGGGGADDWDRGVRDPLQPRLHPLLHPAEQPEDLPQVRVQNTE